LSDFPKAKRLSWDENSVYQLQEQHRPPSVLQMVEHKKNARPSTQEKHEKVQASCSIAFFILARPIADTDSLVSGKIDE
jgi:Ser/Thr protein kinase RdoA (MazF antagonist)